MSFTKSIHTREGIISKLEALNSALLEPIAIIKSIKYTYTETKASTLSRPIQPTTSYDVKHLLHVSSTDTFDSFLYRRTKYEVFYK